MLETIRKIAPRLLLTLFFCAHPPQGVAQQKPESKTESGASEMPEVATRFAEVVRAKNAKGTEVPLKVEVKNWTVSRSARAFEVPDQGFYVVQLISGRITTEIGGKSTARNPGDFWVVEKGQRMAISMKRPQESAGLQTIAVSPGK